MADGFSTEDEQYMIDTLKNFFAEEEWKCDFDEEQKIFSGSIALDGPLSSVRF